MELVIRCYSSFYDDVLLLVCPMDAISPCHQCYVDTGGWYYRLLMVSAPLFLCSSSEGLELNVDKLM